MQFCNFVPLHCNPLKAKMLIIIDIYRTSLGIYVGFLFLCTFCDLIYQETPLKDRQPGLLQTLSRFSYIKNGKALLSTEQKSDDFPFIHGIRVLSSACIVLFHGHFFAFMIPAVNTTDFSDVSKFYAY